ncbi:hypothetical protein BS17DRAFT_730398 [Gyrodon lividus]|nr:hypothetical protein BS17DRAFT_730398 [Gyrodon lividus]
MMLHHLPAEIALDIASYLPLQSLYSSVLVSRHWNSLIAINETTVYKNAALLHQFIAEGELQADSVSSNPQLTRINWKSYCQRQLEIERGWHGKAPSVVRQLTATGTAVHRIKVDEDYDLVITTCQTGGLFVSDAKDNRALWALPPSHVVEYAHCEYDHGYIIFNRHDNCKEVWRRSIDVDDDQVSRTSPPDNQMLEVSTQAGIKFHSASRRGHFRAWALLHMPEITRAFRFSYPTLLASASNNAYIWDVPRSHLIEIIRDTQQPRNGSTLGSINYVEVNDHYAFICGSAQLRVFSRDGGALVYQLSTKQLSNLAWDVLPAGESGGAASSILEPQTFHKTYHAPSSEPNGEFMALHVSASGNDLVALTSSGRLVIIPGFERLFSGSNHVSLEDVAIQLDFRPTSGERDVSLYLAVGNRNGQLAVATRRGIYVISPDLQFSNLTAEHQTHPGVSVYRLSKFDDERVLSFISCLQVTHSAIYFNYRPSQRNDSRGNPRPAVPNANGNAPAPGGELLHAWHAEAVQQNVVNVHEGWLPVPEQDMPALEPDTLNAEEAMLDGGEDELLEGEDFDEFQEEGPFVGGEDDGKCYWS